MTIELITQLFELVVIPLLGIITAYIVKLVNKKITEIEVSVDTELATKYLDMLDKTISECVIATNQTYVESLKSKGEFTSEAQHEAFAKTINAVLTILGDDTIEYLTEAIGDLNIYIETKIESEVKLNKGDSYDN